MDEYVETDLPSGLASEPAPVALSLTRRLELASARRAQVLQKNARAGKGKAKTQKLDWNNVVDAAHRLRFPAIRVDLTLIRNAVVAFAAAFGVGVGGAWGVSFFKEAPESSAQRFGVLSAPSDPQSPSRTMTIVALTPPAVLLDAPTLPQIRPVRYTPAARSADAAALWASVPAVAPFSAVDGSARDTPRVAQALVYVHAPVGVPVARLRSIADEVQGAGASVERIGRETFRVSQTHIRYYSPATAEQAKSLATSLQVEARNFIGRAPANNRVELWVAGQGGGSRASSSDLPTLITQLFEGILP